MSELDRIESCRHPNCNCINSYDERLCVGRIPEKHRHRELFNTHCLCFDGEDYEINSADAYYLASLMVEVIKDVKVRGLYDPCADLAISDPGRRLRDKLMGL